MKIKLETGAYLPQKAHREDAGFDLRVPNWIEYFEVAPHGSYIVDTGVHMQIPYGFCGEIISKSGLNTKHGIISTGLIDCGYTGAIRVKLYNMSDERVIFKRGDKISQIVIKPIYTDRLTIVDELDETERGDNGFGSSGR